MTTIRFSEEKFLRDLDWNLLKVFNEIVRSGGVSRATTVLARRQPAVSLALRRLEDRIGVVLCQRGPGGFVLTDHGHLLAEICHEVEGLVRQIPGNIPDPTGGLRGVLRVGLISNLVNEVLDETMAAFRQCCPRVELSIDVAPWNVIEADLLRNDVDIGLAPCRFPNPGLCYERLFPEVHRPYCSHRHRCFGKEFADPAQLAGEDFVLTGNDEPDALREYRLRHGLGHRVAGQSDHLEEAKRMILAGIGIGFLPEGFAMPEVRLGELWPLTPTSDEPTMDIYVITNPHGPHQRSSAVFLELVHEHMRNGGRRGGNGALSHRSRSAIEPLDAAD